MNKIYYILFFIFRSALFCAAQNVEKDSLFVGVKDQRVMLLHFVKKEETLYSIALKYAVPAIVLSQNNDVSFYEKLEVGRKLFIPLGNYNYFKTKPDKQSRALYYKVSANDRYEQLAKYMDLPESVLRTLNLNKELNSLTSSIALVGWIAFQEDEATNMATAKANLGIVSATDSKTNTISPIVKKDSVSVPPSELEIKYNYQTSNGTNVLSWEGMVTFFKPQTNINSKLLFAFSNDIPIGRIVKIENPSNKNFVFAKIIGNLPNTKQYTNAKIGLDGRARLLLATREIKLWCNYYYR
ncbi:MAG: LysM peptidoglycan-binding domain-containing protein [Phycisphaerales bacterium]|nr:LysM peptidoglycan-binding domain-containing protein [Phycisphaerales bacterium]